MTKVTIQFYALPDEIINFAKLCAEEYGLSLVLIKLFPIFKPVLITDYSLLDDMEGIYYIFLYSKEYNILICSDYMEFLKKNQGFLSLSIGKYADGVLKESCFSFQTEDTVTKTTWNKIARKLKNITKSGVWVISPMTKVKKFYKNCRYTEAAKKVAEQGIKIMPIAGWNYIEFDSI